MNQRARAATASPGRCCSGRGAPRGEGAPEPEVARRAALASQRRRAFFELHPAGHGFLQMLDDASSCGSTRRRAASGRAGPPSLLGRQRRGRGRTQDHGLHPRRAARRPAHRRGAPGAGLDADLIASGLHERLRPLHERQRPARKVQQARRRARSRPRQRRAARPRHVSLVDRAVVAMLAGGAVPSRFLAMTTTTRARAPAMQIEEVERRLLLLRAWPAPRAARRVDAAADGRFGARL